MSSWMLKIAVMLFVACTAVAVQAGSQQADDNTNFSQQQLVDFSKKVEQTAANMGARVFILARVGRVANELPEGIDFTHVGIAVYRHIKLANGEVVPGYVVHNLYIDSQDATQSRLVSDFAFNFFAGATELKAGIIVPTVSLQKRLYELIGSDDYIALHNSNYSTLANPFDSRYQNCTEFTLDVINSAIYQSTDREQLKANAREYFEATEVKESRLKLSVGSMLMEELQLDDHKGKVRTATFGSLSKYLQQYGLLYQQQIIQ